MRFSHFFVDRPIFAAVISIVITLIGIIAYETLPVAQYPEVAPPTVVVSASYPGASAQTVAETVATPLEEQINGVENMLYISNYATLQIKDVLARLEGVGDIQVFGARDYSMRLWLDPDRLAWLGLTTTDIVNAIKAQNVQVASGALNQEPMPSPGAFQLNVETLGRLKDEKQFENVIVKTDPTTGTVTRVSDVA